MIESNIIALVTTIVSLTTTVVVIFINNKHNLRLKEIEVGASNRKYLFERKIVIIEQCYFSFCSLKTMIEDLILLYSHFLSDEYAEKQVNIKMENIASNLKRANDSMESAIIY